MFPSNAVVDGRFALRACIVDYRTEAVDVDALIAEAVARGAALHARREELPGLGLTPQPTLAHGR